MVLLAWNVRGMNKDNILREIRLLLATKRLKIFALNETKIKRSRQEEVEEKISRGWEIVTNTYEMDEDAGDSIWFG